MHRELALMINAFSMGLKQCNRPEDRKLVSDYLSALAPLLARAVLGENIIKDLPGIERLFGHTRLIEQRPFEKAFEHWRTFKYQYEDFTLSGMTVNERLSALELLSEYDQAIKSGDKGRVRRILKSIKLDKETILQIIKGEIKGG
jgi:hypothetical protein